MRYTITRNEIQVVGRIWMPNVVCAQKVTLDAHDLGNAKDEDGSFTRESVARWIDTHCGDFSQIIDFRADFGDDEFVSDWSDEESEFTYSDAMYGDGF